MGFEMSFAVMSNDKVAFFKGNVSADSTLLFKAICNVGIVLFSYDTCSLLEIQHCHFILLIFLKA